ncbi:MAG: hypothetical protein WCX64_02195 [Candidatus Micrarchaeia archaeon]
MAPSTPSKNSPIWFLQNWAEIAWAVLPGVIACLAMLYPFFLSGGEFIYLDWGGNFVSIDQVTHFFQYAGGDWTSYRWIPYYLLQVPFLLAFGTGSSAIFSKLVFLAIFAIGSVGLYLLYREYGIKSKAAYLLSVAIMSFSPFVYERVMMGQFLVVASLFFLPISLYLAKKFVDSPAFKTAWPLALSLSFLNLALQGFVLNTCVVALFLFVNHLFLDKRARRKNWTPYLQLAGVFLFLNLLWLIPYFVLPQSPIFSAIDQSHLSFFSPQSSAGFNTAVKSALMYGSWREVGVLKAFKTLPTLFIYGFVAVLFCLSIYALLRQPRNPLFITLAVGWVIGLVFATGISHPWTDSIFSFFYDHVPMFSGFRDSNKFVELIAAAYAILAPIGIYLGLGEKAFSQKKTSSGYILATAAILVVLVATVAYNYPALGLSGQLHPISYPSEYLSIPSMIPDGEKAILVPSGIYYSYNWSLAAGLDGRLANPSGKFPWLVVSVPSANDFGGTLSGGVYDCLNGQNASCMMQNGVRYALLDSCTSPFDASWATASSELVKETGCLKLFRFK